MNFIPKVKGFFERFRMSRGMRSITRVNLCSGRMQVPGFYNIDINPRADLFLDLEKHLLPFPDNSLEVVICISAINYFTRERGAEIIKDVYRTLKPSGIVRFGVQDLHSIAEKYVRRDREFFYQKREDGSGKDRFPGETMADKFNAWFSGWQSQGVGCRYFYDYETLSLLFKQAGFTIVEQKKYQESLLPEVTQIDNRPEQMFFLEAVK